MQNQNRMEVVFSKNKENNKASLVLYFPIGDPILGDDVKWAKKYFENGCDVLEIGLPYENPMQDGETVRNSMHRSLENSSHKKIFEIIKEIRKENPDNILQIMTYHENIEKYGLEEFAKILHECGVDALLASNATQVQLHNLDTVLKPYNIHNLRFLSYNFTQEAIDDLVENSSGYIFLQAVDGVTGPREKVDPKIADKIKILKESNVNTPIFPGFGIDNAQQAGEMVSYGADGIIVGSAIIRHILEGTAEETISNISKAMMR